MKSAALICCFTLLVSGARSQALQEWFNQKATQKKYLLQQIAALQVYIGYLKKGYDVANKGLTTIKNLKQGHFGLDTAFFNSLKSVNPKIKNSAKVAGIISFNVQILRQYKATIAYAKSQNTFNDEEINYMTLVLGNLGNYVEGILNSLIDIVTSAKLEMTDDERLTRIDHLYDEMQEQYELINEFDGSVKVLSIQRAKEINDIGSVRSMFRK